MKIKKTTGESEDFNEQKFYKSILSAGIHESLAKDVVQEVVGNTHNLQTTDILHTATEQTLVRQEAFGLAAKYNLKRAIVDLGPSGFPFEQYIARVFDAYNYTTKTNQTLQGKCVTHEIDVIAERDNNHYLIECKHHHYAGAKTNVRVALYIYARFLDVVNQWIKDQGTSQDQHAPWLVTNTRATEDAIAYAKCVGMQVLAWHYPIGQGLNHLIENKHLYPITVLPNLNSKVKRALLDNRIILVRELLEHNSAQLRKRTRLDTRTIDHMRMITEQLVQL